MADAPHAYRRDRREIPPKDPPTEAESCLSSRSSARSARQLRLTRWVALALREITAHVDTHQRVLAARPFDEQGKNLALARCELVGRIRLAAALHELADHGRVDDAFARHEASQHVARPDVAREHEPPICGCSARMRSAATSPSVTDHKSTWLIRLPLLLRFPGRPRLARIQHGAVATMV